MKKGNITILASIFIMTLVAAGVSVGTMAYFTDSESITGSSFTAGTVDVRLGGSLPFTGTNMAPGDTRTEYLIVVNDGSLDMLFRVYADNIDRPGFAGYFKVKVTMNPTTGTPPGIGSYTQYGPNDLVLHNGPLNSFIGVANAVDNLGAWRETPSWPLNPGYAAVYQIDVTMDFSTPDAYQGLTLTADLIVEATQADNQATWNVQW